MSGTVFALDAGRVRQLVSAVRPTAESPGDAALGDVDPSADRFARAAWSCIAEPGDGEAGAFISDAGPTGALEAVIDARASGGALGRAGSLSRGFERWIPRVDSSDVIRALEAAARVGARLIVPGDVQWPSGLAALGDHAPAALWCRGELDAMGTLDASIAIVGSRAATGYGEHVAMEASAQLAARGLTIVSGAAYGIDGAAHRAALAGGGTTVAFLAGGPDRFYPQGHHALLERLCQTGAVVSELPCGAAPTRWRFLQRNRLIAASSRAVVVVEAGIRSGSLNTAGHASALGKPVGAVPGPVTSPASAGCHRLLRDYGAQCVTTAGEMAELAGFAIAGGDEPCGVERDTAEETRLLDALSTRAPRTLEDLVKRSGLSRAECVGALGALSAAGRAAERERGWVRCSTRRVRAAGVGGDP
jgi:DNA processing protein